MVNAGTLAFFLSNTDISLQDASLIQQGLYMLGFGMGTVFVFLTLLVFVTRGMSALVLKYFPEPAPAEAKSTPVVAPPDAKLVAAISAAVHAHRNNSKH